MGTTKQPVSKVVDTMESNGYVRRQVAVDDARWRRVGLTVRGKRFIQTVTGGRAKKDFASLLET